MPLILMISFDCLIQRKRLKIFFVFTQRAQLCWVLRHGRLCVFLLPGNCGGIHELWEGSIFPCGPCVQEWHWWKEHSEEELGHVPESPPQLLHTWGIPLLLQWDPWVICPLSPSSYFWWNSFMHLNIQGYYKVEELRCFKEIKIYC